MRKILMIGAGIGQHYLANYIKSQGHFLIAVSLPGDYPVLKIADKVYFEDIFNKEKILDIAKTECIDAVISDQNDLMMPTVAYVAENLKLPGVSSETINNYCNKNKFREICERIGVPVPAHAQCTSAMVPDSMKAIDFPWIVKPADSQSSVGVSKVNNVQECVKAVDFALRKSRTQEAIIEDFFEGVEVVVEGLIVKGKYYNLGFADRKYFNLENLSIPSQTVFPSILPKHILDQIVACEEKLTEFNKPDFALVHSEYIVNPKTEKFIVVESALRGGGVYTSSHLIPLYTGIDVYKILVACALGNEINMEEELRKKTKRASGYVCFYLPEGTVESVDGSDEVKNLPFVKMAHLEDILVGGNTLPITHKGQRLGPIIIEAQNRSILEDNIEKVKQILKIKVKNKDSLTNIIWD